jgi:hypothetical protein
VVPVEAEENEKYERNGRSYINRRAGCVGWAKAELRIFILG